MRPIFYRILLNACQRAGDTTRAFEVVTGPTTALIKHFKLIPGDYDPKIGKNVYTLIFYKQAAVNQAREKLTTASGELEILENLVILFLEDRSVPKVSNKLVI